MNTPRHPHRQFAAERHHSLGRRRFLRGLGVCMALPALESLMPRGLLGATTVGGLGATGAAGAVTATGAPLRMAFLTFANGCYPGKWFPTGDGPDFEFNETMTPLVNVKDKIQVLSGLNDDAANPGPDGPGDHGRGGGTILTSVRCKKTEGADIRAGISIDQVAAQSLGHLTPFPSLQMSCDIVQNAGNCDSGYACVYQKNVSWSSPTSPLVPENNPRLLFERLFGTGGTPAERQKSLLLRKAQQRSVLDFVASETTSVSRDLSTRDNQKLDEYLTSVREIEQRIQRAETTSDKHPDPGRDAPDGIPVVFKDYLRLNLDMLHLAFLTDNTRVASFMFAGDGNNRDFADIGVPDGHHFCTHHAGNADLIAKTCIIENWYVAQLAYFLEKMEATQDVDGHSLLHNSMIMYGTGIADGNRHNHQNLPIILAGAGGGTLTPGRYIKYGSTPIANLYLSMIDRMGVPSLERFGDSTGRLADV
jgi:hypothetical protein